MSERRRLLRTTLLSAGVALMLGAGATGCDDEDSMIGAPCYTESDCPEVLICDFHEGKGSCQENHDHGEDTEGDTDGETDGEG